MTRMRLYRLRAAKMEQIEEWLRCNWGHTLCRWLQSKFVKTGVKYARRGCIFIPCRMINLVSIVGGFRADGSLFQLSFALKLGIMQTAGVAKSSRAVWAAPPFGGINPVAAMASSRGSRTLYHRKCVSFKLVSISSHQAPKLGQNNLRHAFS